MNHRFSDHNIHFVFILWSFHPMAIHSSSFSSMLNQWQEMLHFLLFILSLNRYQDSIEILWSTQINIFSMFSRKNLIDTDVSNLLAKHPMIYCIDVGVFFTTRSRFTRPDMFVWFDTSLIIQGVRGNNHSTFHSSDSSIK